MSKSFWMPVPSAVMIAWTSVFFEHPVESGLFDVDDLAAQRQDRLELRVSAALGGAAGRIAFYDIEF